MVSNTDVPDIEWPEREDKEQESEVLNEIQNLFSQRIQKVFNDKKYVFFISPEPARNIENLWKNIQDECAEFSYKYADVNYGYKNRAWGFFFEKIDLFRLTLPLFFKHRPESLYIIAIEAFPENTLSSNKLKELADFIIFDKGDIDSDLLYTGLAFIFNELTGFLECDTSQ